MKYEVVLERKITERILLVVHGATEDAARRRALSIERGERKPDADAGEDVGEWEFLKATKNHVVEIKDALARARYCARYFGTEYEANPGSDVMEYKDSIAIEYGFESWSDMPSDLRNEAQKLFREGRKAERDIVRREKL